MKAPFQAPLLRLLRLHCRKNQRTQAANTLLITIAFLATVSTLLGITLSVTSTSTQNTRRSAQYVTARSAAEGAIEYAYATWLRRTKGSPITTQEANRDLQPPAFNGVTYATEGVQLRIDALNEYGVPIATGSIPPQVTGRVPGYEGWSGRTFTYAAQARVQVDEKTVVGVRRLFQYTEVPLFQSMFFFQDDLEFYRPATMVLNGLIHSNGIMYLAPTDTPSLTIKGNATYTKGFTLEDPPTAKYWSDGYDPKRTIPKPPDPTWAQSEQAQLHNVPAIQPMGAAPERVFDPDNPNADGFWQLVAPAKPNLTDPPEIKERRLINKAGIVIEVTNTTFKETVETKNNKKSVKTEVSIVTDIKAQNGTVISDKSKIQAALSKVVAREAENISGVSRDALGLYDKRELKRVDTVQFDISLFNKALEKSGGVSNFNNVVYIHDTTPQTSDKNPKAIRIINGSSLPDGGLTIASQNPVYVQGDYNTGGTGSNVPTNKEPTKSSSQPTTGSYTRQPAAIIADAVMFLSNSWLDSQSKSSLSIRTASNTTYNTAVLAGFRLSRDTQNEKSYSGGANNFPRFLEDWTNRYCTYNGSMVQLFESRVFTGRWNTGEIYKPPIRHWNFDTNFLTKPPPGSVEAIVLSRGPWSTF